MTDVPRTYLETISRNVTVAVYADGDLTVDVHDQHGIVLKPAQLRTLRPALERLTAEESTVISLGENQFGDEGYFEWDGSTVLLFGPAFFSESVELSKVDAIALKQELLDLGY